MVPFDESPSQRLMRLQTAAVVVRLDVLAGECDATVALPTRRLLAIVDELSDLRDLVAQAVSVARDRSAGVVPNAVSAPAHRADRDRLLAERALGQLATNLDGLGSAIAAMDQRAQRTAACIHADPRAGHRL